MTQNFVQMQQFRHTKMYPFEMEELASVRLAVDSSGQHVLIGGDSQGYVFVQHINIGSLTTPQNRKIKKIAYDEINLMEDLPTGFVGSHLNHLQFIPGGNDRYSATCNHAVRIIDSNRTKIISQYKPKDTLNWSDWHPRDKHLIAICTGRRLDLADIRLNPAGYAGDFYSTWRTTYENNKYHYELTTIRRDYLEDQRVFVEWMLKNQKDRPKQEPEQDKQGEEPEQRPKEEPNEEPKPAHGNISCLWHPNDDNYLVVSDCHGFVKTFDKRTMRPLQQAYCGVYMFDLQMTPNGQHLFGWCPQTHQLNQFKYDSGKSTLVREIPLDVWDLKSQDGCVYHLQYYVTDKQLFMPNKSGNWMPTESNTSAIRVFDVESGEKVKDIEAVCLGYNPTSKTNSYARMDAVFGLSNSQNEDKLYTLNDELELGIWSLSGNSRIETDMHPVELKEGRIKGFSKEDAIEYDDSIDYDNPSIQKLFLELAHYYDNHCHCHPPEEANDGWSMVEQEMVPTVNRPQDAADPEAEQGQCKIF